MKGRSGLLLALLAATAIAATPSSAVKPRWQTLPVKYRHYPPYTEPFWVAGRVWFLVHREGGRTPLVSARISGGKLTSFVTSSLPDTGFWTLVGSDFVYNPPTLTQARIAALSPNGRLGASVAVPGDPQTRVRQQLATFSTGGIVAAGARVGGRTVWLLAGGEPGTAFHGKSSLAACCTAGGKAVDLTHLLTSRLWGTYDHHLGVDGRGRLWAVWTDSKSNPARNPRRTAHMVELDPDTLAPGAAKVLPTSTGSIGHGLILTCATSCRLVLSPLNGNFSWAPGERAPTKISGPAKHLLSALSRSGKLAISYYVTAKTGYVARLFAARGDARGRRLRVRSSIRPPTVFGPSSRRFSQSGPPLGASTPAGAVVIEGYDTYFGKARALVALLH